MCILTCLNQKNCIKIAKIVIPKILDLGDTVDFRKHYLSFFYAIFVVWTCQDTPRIIIKLLPNQTKPNQAFKGLILGIFSTFFDKNTKK